MTKDITVEDILASCGDAETVQLRAGDVLFREGDEANAMYVVKNGLLRVMSGSTIYETVGPGGIVGEMAIVEEETPRSATAIAGAYSELIEIDVERFLSL